MSEILPRDVLIRVGGRALRRFGVIVGRTAPVQRGGEELIETFARADAQSCARLVDGLAISRIASANRQRVEYVDLDGDGVRETPGILLEPQRANAWDRSTEFAHANWTKISATISTDAITAPDGGSADYLVEDTSTGQHGIGRALTGAADNTRQTFSYIVREGNRTWCWLECIRKDGTTRYAFFNLDAGTIGDTLLASSDSARISGPYYSNVAGAPFWMVSLTVDVLSGGTTPLGRLNASDSGFGTYTGVGTAAIGVWHGQFELDKHYESSPIVNVGAATLTRAGDALTVPCTSGRIVCSLCADIVERTLYDTSHDSRILVLGSNDFVAPYFCIAAFGTSGYLAIYNPGTGAVTSGYLSYGAYNERVRLVANLYADGHVDLARRIGAGAVSVSTPSAAAGAPSGTWVEQTLRVGHGNGTGATAARGMVVLDGMVIRGNHSLAECETFQAIAA